MLLFLHGEPQRHPAGDNLGNPTSPAPCGAGHLSRMHVAQKHALGLEPRVRSGFAITACTTTRA
ncbi:hypothetical protein MES4922_300070 [Mesorhizobium ventifaucium]|uniref:Propionyl-coenzyme A carboxylase alpha polypeptide n=1 Tax=Mesorhizobium ventifaucium TaxID=666020 RepID=A0ABN8K0S1_9HYPH|nr:hypothetical protein MES4922_300070 [Mesorhizobium ventifaucium]